MEIIKAIFLFVWYGVTTLIVFAIALMLLRFVLNVLDVNPFSWSALTIRRLTDPYINPVRRALVGFGVQPNIAPLITILLVILLGWFSLQLVESVLNTVGGVVYAINRRTLVPILGYVLYGLLALYTLLIFIRIIFSWGMVSYANPVMRFLLRMTDPLLVPLRRMIPPLGIFDISPIVAFFILWIFQAAIAGTLLRGMPLQFVN